MEIKELSDVEQKILDAAKIVFVKKGYAATSMGDIAQEAEMSRTALNYYFRTKENLFEAIFGEVIHTLIPQLELIVEEPTPFLEKIEKIVEQYITLLQNNPLLPIFVVNEMNRDGEHLFRIVSGMKGKDDVLFRLMNQITREMEEGTLCKIPLVDVITTFSGMLIFPSVAKNILTFAFFDGDMEQFRTYFRERKKLTVQVMTSLLSPHC